MTFWMQGQRDRIAEIEMADNKENLRAECLPREIPRTVGENAVLRDDIAL